MASVTVDPAGSAGERLTVESIPAVDLRFLTQSELSAFSRCSVHAVDLSRCDDVLIPKIDRSVFNESAGSRKQTYSRFRLARRKPDFSAKPLPLAPGPAVDDPERLDNSKIIVLFKRLFAGADSQAADLPPVSETPTGPSSSTFDGLETASKKRGRKPKSEDLAFAGESKALVVYDGKEESDKVIVNKNGVAVDLEELAKLDDPFAAEIRRRTEGMVKDEELLGFLTSMDGQWGSRRKRRKVVDANEFGDTLPTGWKVLIGMKKKQGRCWLFCRRYISPNGRYFMSCKEVSSYLMSLCGSVDVKAVKQPPPPPSGHCSEASQLDNQLVSVNAETNHGKDQEAISVAPGMLEPDDTVKQNISVKDGHIGMLEEVGLFRCHKCSSPFYDKNQLLHHLLSCHKRKRRKSGMPIEDDDLMKEGHYECQFCNKRFTERVCFFGHVGIHVKNYVKSLEGSPGVNPMQNNQGFVSPGGIPTAPGLEKSESMDVNDDSISFTPDIAASNDLNVDSTYGKLPAKSDPKVPVQTGDHETILSSVDIDQINLVSGTDRTAAEKSTDKADAVPELMDKEAKDVENYFDTADLELDSCEHATVGPSDGKDGTCQTSIEDNVIVEADDVIYSSNVQVQNTNGLLSMVQNSAALLNDSHEFFSEGDNDRAEQVISKSELLGKDRNKTLNENTEARLCNNIDGEPSYSMEFKHRVVDNERIFGSSSSEIGKKMNVTSEAHQERDPSRSSVVPQAKGDTALPESFSGRKSEHCSSSRGDLPGHVLDVDPNVVSLSTSNGVDLGTSDFTKNEIPYDADSFDSNGRGTQSVFVLPGEVISNVVPDNANTVSAFGVLEPGKDDICVNILFPSSVVVPRDDHRYCAENSSSPCRPSSRTEPNSAEVVNSANFFNPKNSLDANHDANKEAVKFLSSHLYSPLGTRDIPGDSDVFGTCSSVIEEPKQKREPGSILSSLSAGGHAHCLAGQIHDTRDSMNDNSSAACATHLPDLSGSISDINTGVLPSFPPQTIPASPSPFSLWNDQPFGVEQDQSRVCDNSREEDRQDRCSETNSLSLTSFQPACNVGYNLNETYISTVDNFSRLNPLETHRDTDLMIGFRNLNSRSNQDVVNEALWRSNEGNAMPSGLGDSSSSHGQLNGAFQPFDFLSDKGENDIFSVSEKYGNITNFGELRSTTVEPMEFSFLTPQDSNPQLGGSKVMSYGNPGNEQGFESSVWLGKGTSLSNVNARSSFSTVCVWCGSQFQQESIDPDTQAGSIGFLCPTCKARISDPF